MNKEILQGILEKVGKIERGSVKYTQRKISDLKRHLEGILNQRDYSEINEMRLTDKVDYGQMMEIAKVMYPSENCSDLVGSIKEQLREEGEIITNQEFFDRFRKFGDEDRKNLGEQRVNIIETYFRYIKS